MGFSLKQEHLLGMWRQMYLSESNIWNTMPYGQKNQIVYDFITWMQIILKKVEEVIFRNWIDIFFSESLPCA